MFKKLKGRLSKLSGYMEDANQTYAEITNNI